MRRWRRRCRTRGTCSGTTCGASAAFEEAIAEFLAADALEAEYFKAEKIPVEYDWHYQHNLDLLATSYQYVGQMTTAEQRFRASFAIPSSLVAQEFNKREWPVFLLARGRAAEALEAASVMAGHRSPIVSATGHVEAGRARLALGQFKEAADEGNAALRLMRGTEGAGMVATALAGVPGRVLPSHRPEGQGAADVGRGGAQGAGGAGAGCVDAGAVHAGGDRPGGARGRRLGPRRLGGPSDGGARPELRGRTLCARAWSPSTRGDARTARTEAAAAAKLWSTADRDLPELNAIKSLGRQP